MPLFLPSLCKTKLNVASWHPPSILITFWSIQKNLPLIAVLIPHCFYKLIYSKVGWGNVIRRIATALRGHEIVWEECGGWYRTAHNSVFLLSTYNLIYQTRHSSKRNLMLWDRACKLHERWHFEWFIHFCIPCLAHKYVVNKHTFDELTHEWYSRQMGDIEWHKRNSTGFSKGENSGFTIVWFGASHWFRFLICKMDIISHLFFACDDLMRKWKELRMSKCVCMYICKYVCIYFLPCSKKVLQWHVKTFKLLGLHIKVEEKILVKGN